VLSRKHELHNSSNSSSDNDNTKKKGYDDLGGRLASAAIIAGIVAALVVAASSSELLELAERSLAFHMTAEHLIFFAAGALVIQLILKIFKRPSWNRSIPEGHTARTVILLAVAAAIVAIWHYPVLFAAATFEENLHLLQHGSFILTGMLAFIALRSMPAAYLILFVILMGAVMGISGALLLVAENQIFFPYSIPDQRQAGNAMVIFALVMTIVVTPVAMISHSLRHELRAR
jgi:hypothetical protein